MAREGNTRSGDEHHLAFAPALAFYERSHYYLNMSKGEATRAAILSRALDLSSVVGLNGLSIGALAQDMSLSKSGLFAHFGSKEALQLAVLDEAEQRFADTVIKPAWREPGGLPRLRAVFERWLVWDTQAFARGGCLFMAAAKELDDQPGPVRDRLVAAQRKWFESLVMLARSTAKRGDFRAESDPEQFAYELYGIVLGYHHAARLMRDPRAAERARAAFDHLLDRNR